MMDRRALFAALAASLARPTAVRAEAKVLSQVDLPTLDLRGYEVKTVEVSYAPGAVSAKHRHPGFVFGYVLEGEVRFQVSGQPEVTLTAGQTFHEGPGDIHLVSGNASKSKPAKFLAFMIVEKGKALTAPA